MLKKSEFINDLKNLYSNKEFYKNLKLGVDAGTNFNDEKYT